MNSSPVTVNTVADLGHFIGRMYQFASASCGVVGGTGIANL